tara:strand:- start:161 stop:1216 length:1056 start_codon:yes stop_codon:yes gene_type:complete
MNHLDNKSKGIESGTIHVQVTKQKVTSQTPDKNLETIQLNQLSPGWNSLKNVPVYDTKYWKGMNPFVLMVHLAFKDHYSLKISPDTIWMVIIQGFSVHINKNPEKYRDRFVNHEGKIEISIIRDNFSSSVEDNKWTDVFPEFAEKITDIIGSDNSKLVLEEFTTTGPSDFMGFQVVLMDLVKEFFDYRCYTRCGIPEFDIKGTVEDWQKIKSKCQEFRKFDLGYWIDNLDYFLDKMISIVSGNDERSFLSSFYKYQSFSGGNQVTGEILRLFPYMVQYNWDKKKKEEEKYDFKNKQIGISTSSFLSGQTKVPFIWNYHGVNRSMNFITKGFITKDRNFLELRHNVNVSSAN